MPHCIQAKTQDKTLKVVTTIAPIYALTAGVMQSIATPKLLMQQGDTPHHYAMRPKDAQLIANATLIIGTSKEYDYYLQPLLNAMPERPHRFIAALDMPDM
ncbi:MAG: zinc ABC transporter substrate-binding protein, partial [Alphaproteobacteria bacterium]|nr:zinc ABC transporter substrate-binding protein [Alphaproteobacteria bacterium]